MVYVWHHLAALVLAAAGVLAMLRGTWPQRTPRLAILAWQTLAVTVIVALAGTLFSLGLEPYHQGILPALAVFIPGVLDGMTGGSVTAAQYGFLAAAAVLVMTIGSVLVASAVRVARRRRRLRTLVSLVGRPMAGASRPDLFVVEHSAVAVYCIPGRASDVVISAGALHLLTQSEIEAVLAHERAHIRQRHDLVLFPFAALARAFPRSRLLTAVADRIELLVEMSADDYAVSRYGTRPLAGALARFEAVGVAVPEESLAAGATRVAARRARLRDRRTKAAGLVMLTVIAAAAALLSTPVSLFVLPL